MRSFVNSVKLGSSGLWPAVLTVTVAFGAAGLLAGCFVQSSSHTTMNPPPDNPPAHVLDKDPKTVVIDPDKALQQEPGEGVGVFVEYMTGGHWHVWTSCDTNSSKAICNFTAFLIVDIGGQISNVQGENLENDDLATLDASGSSVELDVHTSSEFDGVTFDATPGATVQLEVYLDNDPDPRLVYWVGGDVLHQGAPTDPINFEPAAP
jgi:hypothetical protein